MTTLTDAPVVSPREVYLRAARSCFAIATRYHDRFMLAGNERPAVCRELNRRAQAAGDEGNKLLAEAAKCGVGNSECGVTERETTV